MEIQKTSVSQGRVEMLIADAAAVEQATDWISFSVAAQSEQGDYLGDIQLAALQTVRTAIGEQIRAINSIRGRFGE